MPIGSNLNITLPTSGLVQWDSTLNAALQALIDAVQAKVTVDGIDITAALDMQGNYLLNLDGLKFKTAADDGTAQSIFWATVSGKPELFVRDGAGNAIQVTSGGALNISVNGGIGGDYVGSSAQLVYTSSGAVFTFTSSPGVYSTVQHGDVQLHAGSAASYTDLKSSPVLAGTYNVTLPSGAPATTLPVVMDSTGSLATTTNISGLTSLTASNAQFTNVAGLTSLTASNAQFTNSVALTGIGPASGYGFVVANQTGSLSTIQSGTFTRWIDVSCGISAAGAPSYNSINGWNLTSAGDAVDIGLPYNEGDRIDSIIYTTQGTSTTASLYLRSVLPQGGVNEHLVARKTFNAQTACSMSNGATTMTGALQFTPTTGTLVLQVVCGNGGVDQLGTVRVTWLRKLI